MARRRRPDRSASRPDTRPEGADERPDERHDERLQKVLAAAGIASRRECEELIQAGRVEVDRKTVTELGTKVDPLRSEIRVDGVVLPQPKRLYFALNKPPGVVCTNFDPSGRTRVIDLISTDQRTFPVGRLDRTSEGLILVTNDGALANRLTHPRYGVTKLYQVLVAGTPSTEDLELLRQGVRLAEGWARAESVRVRRRTGKSCELLIELKEGRNREIRRMLARIEHKVLRLRRVAVGPILLGDLPLGAHRKLTLEEVGLLEQAVRDARRERRKKRREQEAGTDDASRSEVRRKVRPRKPKVEAAGDDEDLGDEALPPLGGRTPKPDRRRKPGLPPSAPANRSNSQEEPDPSGPPAFRRRPGAVIGSETYDQSQRGRRSGGRRPTTPRPIGGDSTTGPAPFGARPAGPATGGPATGGRKAEGERPPGRPRFTPRPQGGRPGGGRPKGGRPSGGKPSAGRPQGGRPAGGKPSGGKPGFGRPSGGKPGGGRPKGGGPKGGRPGGGRPKGRRPGGGRS